ncbi:unnamed protein product [Rangifer tarandus platyrhynchus]|uniref:Uncharacterized protein n=1 Tax=Rangifer tarandus platyrhynchus TaxID=3082113 RepID=A0AC59YRG9_RANTA
MDELARHPPPGSMRECEKIPMEAVVNTLDVSLLLPKQERARGYRVGNVYTKPCACPFTVRRFGAVSEGKTFGAVTRDFVS